MLDDLVMVRQETDLFHHAMTLLVSGVVTGPDGGCSQVEESVAYKRSESLRDVSVTPEGTCDPVPHLVFHGIGIAVGIGAGVEGDGAYGLISRLVVLDDDGIAFVGLEHLADDTGAFAYRAMRSPAAPIGDLGVLRPLVQTVGVLPAPFAKDKPVGDQFLLRHRPTSMHPVCG